MSSFDLSPRNRILFSQHSEGGSGGVNEAMSAAQVAEWDSPLLLLRGKPLDPIMKTNGRYRVDTREERVGLHIGYALDAAGKIIVPDCIFDAMEEVVKLRRAGNGVEYLPQLGNAKCIEGSMKLLFGPDHPVVKEKRYEAINVLGGTGGLFEIAYLLASKRYEGPKFRVGIPKYTWAPHASIFEELGYDVTRFDDYNPETHQTDFPSYMRGLEGAFDGASNPLLLIEQACCQNPTGLNRTKEEWREYTAWAKKNMGRVVVVFDMPYFKMGAGRDDAFPVELFAQEGIPFVVILSGSKTLGLYRDRVATMMLVLPPGKKEHQIASALQTTIRNTISSAAGFGTDVAALVLNDAASLTRLEADWQNMRDETVVSRQLLANHLEAYVGNGRKFDHVRNGQGLATLLTAKPEVVEVLENQNALYVADLGREDPNTPHIIRVNPMAINDGNRQRVHQLLELLVA